MANTNGPQVTAARQIAALDEVDQRLLDELVADGRLSMRALAERVHISRAGCYTRVERLQRDGIITGHTAIVDARRLGCTLLAHVYPKGPFLPRDHRLSHRRRPSGR
jgi:DNA-binding Lrp family transcriptional regulator